VYRILFSTDTEDRDQPSSSWSGLVPGGATVRLAARSRFIVKPLVRSTSYILWQFAPSTPTLIICRFVGDEKRFIANKTADYQCEENGINNLRAQRLRQSLVATPSPISLWRVERERVDIPGFQTKIPMSPATTATSRVSWDSYSFARSCSAST